MTLGKPRKRGHITKEGRRDVRGVMVEAGCRAVEHHPHWKAQFERLTRRIGKQKAIVAIARKLLVAVWHVLTERQAVARKLMNWITHHGVIPGQHRDRLLLLYQHLDELGLSEELEEIDYYGTTYRLSVRQQLLREARDVEEFLRLPSGSTESTTPQPHIKAKPYGCSASLRSLDTGPLAWFLGCKPD
jgi:transposase